MFENRQCFAEICLGVWDARWIQPEPLFSNLLATLPSARNCMASMAHAMLLGSTGLSFVTMSEEVQV